MGKTLKVFNTETEYNNFYSNGNVPSSDIAFVKENNFCAFTTNNVDGIYQQYSGTMTVTPYSEIEEEQE